jgi:hypothetical protein
MGGRPFLLPVEFCGTWLVISGYTRSPAKTAGPDNRRAIDAIIHQAVKNKNVLKLMQEAEFLCRIDPCDTTCRKLIKLNHRVEEQLRA